MEIKAAVLPWPVSSDEPFELEPAILVIENEHLISYGTCTFPLKKKETCDDRADWAVNQSRWDDEDCRWTGQMLCDFHRQMIESISKEEENRAS